MNWHWEILIIPLIALGVWILGTLFKSGEDDKARKGVRRPGNGSGRGAVRRPVTDLDRFLEEARRRREEEERPMPRPAPVRPAPVRVPPRQAPVPPRETPRKVPPAAPPIIRRAELPVVVPAARPVEQPTPSESAPTVASAREALSPLVTPPTTRAVPPSPILQQVRSLLSKPQTAGTAFVLREIFDRPLCLRRRIG